MSGEARQRGPFGTLKVKVGLSFNPFLSPRSVRTTLRTPCPRLAVTLKLGPFSYILLLSDFLSVASFVHVQFAPSHNRIHLTNPISPFRFSFTSVPDLCGLI